MVMSPDGGRLYVASITGGIAVIDTKTDQLLPGAITVAGSVHDLVVTPDGKKLFMAMNRNGVWRVLTTNGGLKQITDRICPVNLGLDSQGRTLYVPYQCGGPTGRAGPDPVEVFDPRSQTKLGIGSGPPLAA